MTTRRDQRCSPTLHPRTRTKGDFHPPILRFANAILGLDLSMGGHLTHGSPVNFSCKLYLPFFYGVNKEDGRVDYDALEKQAQ